MKRIIDPTEYVEQINKLASIGLTLDQISACCKVSVSTIKRWFNDFEEVRVAYDNGRAIAAQKVLGKMWEGIEQGDRALIIFYLKTQCKWQEVQKIEHSGELSTTTRIDRNGGEERLSSTELDAILQEKATLADTMRRTARVSNEGDSNGK